MRYHEIRVRLDFVSSNNVYKATKRKISIAKVRNIYTMDNNLSTICVLTTEKWYVTELVQIKSILSPYNTFKLQNNILLCQNYIIFLTIL